MLRVPAGQGIGAAFLLLFLSLAAQRKDSRHQAKTEFKFKYEIKKN